MRQPIVTVIDLPLPPSVNRIWQHNKAGKKVVSRSRVYRKWLLDADNLGFALAQFRGAKTIHGPFTALIELSRKKVGEIGGDPDNRIKALLDYAQSRFLIANDKHLEELWLRKRGEDVCPHGVRMTLTEVLPVRVSHETPSKCLTMLSTA